LTSATVPLEKAIELKPNDKEVMGLLAACYRAGSNREGLANLLTAWCAFDKNNFDIRRELGELYFADSKLSQATAILEEALNLKPCTIDLHLLLANIYEVQNTPDQWGGHLRSALGCDSKNPDLFFEISRYFESLKDTARVMEYLQQTLQLAPAHGEANYKMGYLLLQKNNVSEALNYLSKAVKANPTSKNLLTLSEAYFKLNKKGDALAIIRPILSKVNDPQVLRWAGNLYKENGFLDSAQQLLEKSIQNNTKCMECYVALADLLFDSYSFIDAAKNYQSAIDLGDSNEKDLIKAARTYSMIGKDDAARKIFETIVAGNFPNDEVMYRLCHLYIRSKQIDRARTLLERMDTKSGYYFLTSGELLETEVGGDKQQIVNAFRKANELLPDVSEVQAGYGRISLARNDFNMAIEYFAKAMGGDPENCQYMIDMGKAYEGIKEYPSAMDLYKEVERRQPGNSEVDVLIARLVSKKSDHFEAIMIIKDKIEKNKKNGLLYIELGNEYRLINQFQEAIDAYSKAIKYDEKQCFEAYRYLGLVFNDRGDQKKAKKNFENYITLGGQDKTVIALLKKYK
jgi:tetratricopeptide (TPR) repeat protein